MQIGFVNFDSEERKRVNKIMQLLQESVAIEELGIGRVRDFFSNTLFPGTSTLQHHAKYFVILPSLYYHTANCNKNFRTLSEVDSYIKEAEIQITRQLAENADGSLKADTTGITGINTYKEALNDYRKYVKYDPAYIYGSGLVRYGIIPDANIEQLVLELNKSFRSDPHSKSIDRSEDMSEDSDDLSGNRQMIKTCGEAYDFFKGRTMDILLSETEASFLKDRILSTCKGTLLSYLIERETGISRQDSYFEIGAKLQGLDASIMDIYRKSVLFSKLLHLIDWRFNCAYYKSFGMDEKAEECNEAYEELCIEYQDALQDKLGMDSLFDFIKPIDIMMTEFCEKCYDAILVKDYKSLDELITARERTVKRERSKIGNPSYSDEVRQNPTPNTFRWDTVKTLVYEIRNPK